MVWTASPSGCRLGDLASLNSAAVPGDSKKMFEEMVEEVMDYLVWCFCPAGDSILHKKCQTQRQRVSESLVELCGSGV